MKLYRLRVESTRRGGSVLFTKFKTSLVKAKAAARDCPLASVSECEVNTKLTAADWVDLLETDAPGEQDFLASPVDFITSEKMVWTKGTS